jgi:hypothetical protein
MAIIKIGPPLSGIRGTIGGIVYSANGSSVYAKQWARGSNPRTNRQTTERANFSEMPGLWTALTDPQRAAWRTFAADPAQELTNPLGEAYYASGFNWFAKCNVRLKRVGRATISAVPVFARPAAPTIDDFRVCVAGPEETTIAIGGTASASTTEPGSSPANAFDQAISTNWSTLTGNPTGWLQYILTASANVKHYAIYGPTANSRLAKDWTFETYSGGAWRIIHTVTNMTWPASAWYHFYCANAYTETWYRLNITANMGHPNTLRVHEVSFFPGDVEASVVCYPEDNFEHTPDYDLVLHVSMGRSVGMGVQYPGFYEILAVQSPGRWFALCQDELEAVFGVISENRTWFARLYRQTTEGLRSTEQAWRAITLS